jgi:hypothetical protein
VDGHHIDLYMPSQAGSKEVRPSAVKVVILKYGDDEAGPADPQQKAEAKAVNRNVACEREEAPGKMIIAIRAGISAPSSTVGF